MKKKILFVVDVPDWAYDDAAKNWKKMLAYEYDIDILYLDSYEPVRISHKLHRLIKEYQSNAIAKKNVNPEEIILSNKFFLKRGGNKFAEPIFNHEKYDGIYFFYHRALCDARLLGTPIPMSKVAIAINNEKWEENGANEEFLSYMKGAKILVGCNNHIISSFKKFHPNVMRASQCIDEKVFFYNRDCMVSKRAGSNFIVGWTGNFSNKIKNYDMVKNACDISGVKFVKAKDLSRSDLNEWYNKVDAVVIASDSEGGPLMLLEAGAVGIPVISTSVGLSREIIKHNENGIIANRNAHAISAAIDLLSVKKDLREKLAANLKKDILEKWTYKARINEIKSVLAELCK